MPDFLLDTTWDGYRNLFLDCVVRITDLRYVIVLQY